MMRAFSLYLDGTNILMSPSPETIGTMIFTAPLSRFTPRFRKSASSTAACAISALSTSKPEWTGELARAPLRQKGIQAGLRYELSVEPGKPLPGRLQTRLRLGEAEGTSVQWIHSGGTTVNAVALPDGSSLVVTLGPVR